MKISKLVGIGSRVTILMVVNLLVKKMGGRRKLACVREMIIVIIPATIKQLKIMLMLKIVRTMVKIVQANATVQQKSNTNLNNFRNNCNQIYIKLYKHIRIQNQLIKINSN